MVLLFQQIFFKRKWESTTLTKDIFSILRQEKYFIFERNSGSPWEAHLAPILYGADLILYSKSEECLEVAPGLK